ncbi:MAG TPA: ABC-F family ATP-binding cassette domain-containing protein [Opitutaceae bacterium]|nr:ABC-F family ATP-binding cassette domain-containing protein [Opitutaceae bacterium]
MLTLAGIAKRFGTRTLFAEVAFTVVRGDRLGLVGANGAGKSTLFRLILDEESPDEGTLTWQRGTTVGFLPQETAPIGDETILQIATGISAAIPARAGPAAAGSPPHDPEDYRVEPRARQILAGLGFRPGDDDRPARAFSGGWVMRAHLARLLVQSPDLLLLDEPTNHLDLEALLWFQDHLSRYPGALVMISHDRAFLNALCTGVLELRRERLWRWHGNYDEFIRQRDAHEAHQRAAWKNQQREVAHLQRFIDRFGAKASLASRAKSKERQIAHILAAAIDAPEAEVARLRFRFPQAPRSGRRVVTLTDVTQAYDDRVVYRGLHFAAERGQRIVLVGPNGAGKSTLLKILAGVVPLQAGTRELGHNVRAGYYSQNRIEVLPPGRTVLEAALEMRAPNPELTEQAARTLLGAFLFRKDDVFKPIGILSGGEKSRLALARLLLAPPNLLLMDEPGTHLDIPSTDALLAALDAYTGTLIFISHDVYFIRAIANRVLHIAAGRLTPYHGNYDYYLEKSHATDGRAAVESGGDQPVPPARAAALLRRPALAPAASRARERRRADAQARAAKSAALKHLRGQVHDLEQEIGALEERQAQLTALLETPATYAEPGRPAELNRELTGVVNRLHAANAEWEAAASELESLERR